MPILLKTQIEGTAKAPIPACRARVGGLCGFQDTVERCTRRKPEDRTLRRCTGALAENIGTGRDGRGKSRLRQMREIAENGQNRGILDAAARKQPAMDLSRDKNAEEMKWSPLEMGAAMQAHGA